MSSTRGREAPRRVHAQWRALADATRAAGSLRLGALGVDIGRPKTSRGKDGLSLRNALVSRARLSAARWSEMECFWDGVPEALTRTAAAGLIAGSSSPPRPRVPVRPLRPSGTTDSLRMRRCLPRGNSVSEGGVVGRSGVEYPGSAAPTDHDPDRRHPTRRLRGLRQGRRRRRGAIEWPDQTGGRNPAYRGQHR